MRHRFTRVSIERILSGPGIEALYQALASIRGVPTKPLSSADITRLGLAHSCPVCTETLDRFCTILGSFAGDVALTLGALGGVYITGGIVPRFLDYLKNSRFRERFEAKGRFDNYMQAIPTYVVTAKFPGLTGAAAILGSNHQI
jgi:glucokinase